MGLLDDAIREHLELKRRRGADAEEVTRQEHEALGPPQRGEFADAAGAEPTAPRPPSRRRARRARRAAPRGAAPSRGEEPERPSRRAGAASPSRSPRSPSTSRRVEYTPEPAPAATPRREDVLEETPDFLQETPEHDRLWFEQKPPRDFDLDR